MTKYRMIAKSGTVEGARARVAFMKPLTPFDRFVERHTLLCYAIAMPIAGALGIASAIALWRLIMVEGVCRIAC